MNYSNKSYLRIFTALMACFLLAITFQFDLSNTNQMDIQSIKISLNDAEARSHHDEYYMTTTYCWETGEPIWICKVGEGNCCVSCQGTCSSSDPGEG